MRRPRLLATLAVMAALSGSAWAAPLFPDVPDNHWAKDAVAALAAKGLVEGYPDGTFKGDRAASRWEVAMIVARLLAKMEQEHATFATKAELGELRKLVDALREELEALGVRVTNLEENVSRLDKRVTELERITFYGQIVTRAGFQNFKNTGRAEMRGAPGPATVPYTSTVGTAVGAGGLLLAPSPGAGLPYNQFVVGVPGVTDWLHGRPLTNGATFTARADLGVNIKVSPDIDAGAEFSAYTSQGDQVVDAFWGVTPAYQSNVFTGTSSSGLGIAGAATQPLNNFPNTRMTLDHIWVQHKPSGTKLVLGSFSTTDYDPMVYAPEPNPTVGGPARLDSFGVQVKGRVPLEEGDKPMAFSWEVIGTKLADGNIDLVTTNSYFNHAEGLNLGLHFDEDRGVARFNFLHAANDASSGQALGVGMINFPNLVLGWVNPAGNYINQLGAGTLTAGIGSVTDVRPVPMAGATDGITGVPGTLNVGGIGPQSQNSWGGSVRYTFDNEYKPWVYGEYAHSTYTPSRNSNYSVGGNLMRVGAGASFFEERVNVDVNYLKVDPTYDPFVLQFPTVAGITTPYWRIPDLNQYWNLYSLHDTGTYPQNRQGIRANLGWKFSDTGKLNVSYGNLDQVRTSLQDVRFSTGALGAGIPNTPVLGFSPGFMDPAFLGFSQFTFAPSGGNTLAIPLENRRGNLEQFTVSASHKFLLEEGSQRGVTLSGLYLNDHWRRNSTLSGLVAGAPGLRGESENFVNFTIAGANASVGYDVTDNFHLTAAYTQLDVFGHIDPLGVYSNFAAATGSTRFKNWDITQHIPELAFNWDVTSNTSWGVDMKYYIETDHLPASLTPSPTLPSLNVALPVQTAHPFNYSGYQIMSTYSLKF